MLKKTITYTDYNGMERTEDFYFNLTKAEVVEMQYSIGGGLKERLESIVNTKDQPSIMELATDADKAAEFVNGIIPKIKAEE